MTLFLLGCLCGAYFVGAFLMLFGWQQNPEALEHIDPKQIAFTFFFWPYVLGRVLLQKEPDEHG